MRRLTVAPLVVLATACAASPASAEVVATTDRATPVDADAGVVVWSDLRADRRFHLVARRDGRIADVPVAPQRGPFDVDAGTDAQGRPALAFARCSNPEDDASCDVHRWSWAEPVERPVPGAGSRGIADTAPTVDRGRVVWVRGANDVRLSERTRTTSLPGSPSRRCSDVIRARGGGRLCERVRLPATTALELRGDRLAQVGRGQTSFDAGYGQLQVRLVSVRRRTSTLLLERGTGESGPGLIGPSVEGGFVYVYRACFGDPSGCDRGNAGVFRLRPDGRGRPWLAGDGTQLSGWSLDGTRELRSSGSERDNCELEQGDYPGVPGLRTGPCPITEGPASTRFLAVRR